MPSSTGTHHRPPAPAARTGRAPLRTTAGEDAARQRAVHGKDLTALGGVQPPAGDLRQDLLAQIGQIEAHIGHARLPTCRAARSGS